VTGFDLYPAIDVRGGRCVRLLRGDYERETVYGDDPVAQARRFEAAGARWIHVVDLDAARTGEPVNRLVVEAICAAVGCRVQASGGVRTVADADALIAAGVERVVVGTAAVEDPALVEEMAAAHPRRIAVGLDARGRDVAVRGWTESTGRDLVDVARAIEDRGAAALVVTEIGRDGTLEGPALDQLAAVLEAVGVPVVASGGVGSLDDLRALAALDVGGRRLAGAIAGRAIYEGRFEVEEGLAACSRPG
jgi:phosphoribosylformimino-5-aminoimidazole carboxamide ribotide isomerase